MFITLIPAPLDDLSGMRLILLDCRVGEQPHVVVHIKVKQRARLSSSLVHYEIIECVMLKAHE